MTTQKELVAKFVVKFAVAEMGLFKARRALADIEDLVMEGRKLDMVDGDNAMRYICELGILAGQIAAVEKPLYPLHAEFTAIAQEKGIDTGEPYSVLKAYMPVNNGTKAKSGGGRR